MKRILLFAFTTLLLITLAACGGNGGDNKASNALLVGSWAAQEPAIMNASGMTITFSDMTAIYAADRTAKASAKMSISGAGLPIKIMMNMATTSTWKIEGDQLKETITNIDLKMLTKIPGMPDMSGMIAEGMKGKGSVQIIKLDKNTFEFKDAETGMQVVLKRQ